MSCQILFRVVGLFAAAVLTTSICLAAEPPDSEKSLRETPKKEVKAEGSADSELPPATNTVVVVSTPTIELELPADIRDPAFDRYVDVWMLGKALVERDPGALTDAALQLAEGERILHRQHKATSADQVLKAAIRLAGQKRDQATLERLGRVAAARKAEDLSSLVQAYKKLAGTPRAVESHPDLEKVKPEVAGRYRILLEEIETGRLTHDASRLDVLQRTLKADDHLDKVLIADLNKRLKRATEELPEQLVVGADLLQKLADASRGTVYILTYKTDTNPGYQRVTSIAEGNRYAEANRKVIPNITWGVKSYPTGQIYLTWSCPTYQSTRFIDKTIAEAQRASLAQKGFTVFLSPYNDSPVVPIPVPKPITVPATPAPRGVYILGAGSNLGGALIDLSAGRVLPSTGTASIVASGAAGSIIAVGAASYKVASVIDETQGTGIKTVTFRFGSYPINDPATGKPDPLHFDNWIKFPDGVSGFLAGFPADQRTAIRFLAEKPGLGLGYEKIMNAMRDGSSFREFPLGGDYVMKFTYAKVVGFRNGTSAYVGIDGTLTVKRVAK